MKTIVIGSSLSGKTTIVQFIRENYKDVSVSEIDEHIVAKNNYEYPADNNYKHKVIVPEIVKDILKTDQIIFFTNTDYFEINDLVKAKQKGFKIVLLEASYDELIKRNQKRSRENGYADMTEWLKGMLNYQNRLKEEGIIDKVIVATNSTEQIVSEILEYI